MADQAPVNHKVNHKAVIDRCQICIGLQFQDCKPVCFYSPKHSRNTGYQHVRGTEVCLTQSQRQLKPQFWNGIITYWKDNWAFFILKNQEICISMWWVVVTVSLHFWGVSTYGSILILCIVGLIWILWWVLLPTYKWMAVSVESVYPCPFYRAVFLQSDSSNCCDSSQTMQCWTKLP